MKTYSEFDSIYGKLACIHGIDDIPRFLYPKNEELHSPYLLKNIEAARDIIVDAIDKQKNVSIHIDVDTDGVSSGATMFNYLKRFGSKVKYFHAQRSEGHGVEISEKDIPNGTELLIIIDSSTNSVESCRRIRERAIEIVVLDHHEQDLINEHCVLVNPQQEGCNYPNKQISAATVVWKMCQVLDDYYDTNYSEDYYDIVAIGMQGDLMNIIEPENRYIVYKGINNIKNIGIKALLQESNKDTKKINSTDVGFIISPNINAACRMDKIELVIELMVETDSEKATELAKQVLELNEERKRIQAYFNNKLISSVDSSKKCSIILDEEIGKGFKGLVAGDFSNKFQRPIMILSSEGDMYLGSYRAYGELDLKSMLNGIPEVIMAAGHAGAGGIRFLKQDLHKIQDYIETHISNETSEQYLEYLLEFELEELNDILIKNIETFYHINGKGFETGKFLIKNVNTLKKEVLGKGKNTVKIHCYPADRMIFLDDSGIKKLNPTANLMKFRTNEQFFDEELIGKEINVVGVLNLNSYFNPYKKKNVITNQIFIDDYKVIG